MLKIQFRHKSERIIDIENAVSTLGRHESNDVVIDDPDILDFHAEFHVQDNSVFLLCLGENNQTLINNETLTLWRQLQVGDVIEFGTEILDVIDSANMPNHDWHQPVKPTELSNLDSTEHWLLIGTNTAYGKLALPNNKTIVVGRDSDCDIVIREGLISRRHAEIILKNNLLHVKDLGSTNGTFINSKRINETYVKHDDEIRFDEAAFRVVDPQHDVSSLLDAHDPSTTGQRSINTRPSSEVDRQELLDNQDEPPNLNLTNDSLDFNEQPYLIGFSSLIKNERFLLNKPHMTIGRASLSDIVLEAATISVEHAEIVFEDDSWFINDVGSLNGTFINDKKILSAKLNNNDIVKIGTVELKFCDTTAKLMDQIDMDEGRSPIGRTVEYVQNLFGAKASSSVVDDKKKREFKLF